MRVAQIDFIYVLTLPKGTWMTLVTNRLVGRKCFEYTLVSCYEYSDLPVK